MADLAPIPRRGRRRWWRLLAMLMLLLIVAAVLALPWALGTAPARRWILATANRVLAPSALHFDALSLSWFGPTTLRGVVLRDPTGDRVVVAPSATWDRNLLQILLDRPRLGTLTLHSAAFDVERAPDGTIDLFEAIKPVFQPNPKLDLTIRVDGGSLRLRGAGLAEPLVADRAELVLHRPPAPSAMSGQIRLWQSAANAGASLDISGSFDRWNAPPGRSPALTLNVQSRRWPLAFDLAGNSVRGRLEGDLGVERKDDFWGVSGTAAVLGLDAQGPALAGDRLRLDRIGGTLDVAESADEWTVKRLDLESPLGTLKAEGAIPLASGSSTRVVGRLDLAAIGRQLPHALRFRDDVTLERGTAQLVVEGRSRAGGQDWTVSAEVSDLVAKGGGRSIALREPATFSAALVREGGNTHVDHLGLKTAFLDARAKGDLEGGLAIAGTLDLGGLRRQFGDLIDFGDGELAGKGTFNGDYRHQGPTFAAHITADLTDLRASGLHRESAHLDATVDGPAGSSGLPRSWASLGLGLKSVDLAGHLKATARDDGADLVADVSSPIRLADRDGRAEGRAVGHWAGQALDLLEIRVALVPAGQAPTIAWSARGRFDREAGDLVLRPLPGATVGSIALASEGLHVVGLGRAWAALRADGAFVGDIAALTKDLAAWTGRAPTDLAGSWSSRWSARGGDKGIQLAGQVAVRDLSWPGAEGQARQGASPIDLALRAVYRPEADRAELSELVLSGPYGAFEASGDVSDLGGRRLADLHGTVSPDWEAINRTLADSVEPNARIEGQGRPFHLRGPLVADSTEALLKGLDAEIGIDLVKLDVYGMKVGPTPVVLRTAEGRLAIDPIRTTLNNGRLRLDPEVRLERNGGATVRLGAGSAIEGAEINDEVSLRVLSFVAPVLQQATRVSGLISAEIERAEFPIARPGGPKAVVEGRVVFRDVEFSPGPMAADLLGLIGRADRPLIRMDQPVHLAIADGRVYQKGLAIPIGDLTRIELEGSVGFDRDLDLVASLPITPAMLGNNRLLGEIAAGARISVPIRGTLSRPRVDREAIGLGMKDMGKGLLERGAFFGAGELLNRLTRPRDPALPPPPTAEERRARRMERKAERQAERQRRREGLDPPP